MVKLVPPLDYQSICASSQLSAEDGATNAACPKHSSLCHAWLPPDNGGLQARKRSQLLMQRLLAPGLQCSWQLGLQTASCISRPPSEQLCCVHAGPHLHQGLQHV